MTSSYGDFGTDGVAIRELTLAAGHPGKVFWVASSSNATTPGSNGNEGSFDRPFGTVDYAIGQCTASRGDIIFVKAGYTESITAAAGWDCDVAGITIVGLGKGTNRPTVTFTTATTADIDIDAANVTIINIRFVCGIASQAAMIDVNDDHFSLVDCEFTESSATGLVCVDINGGSANACDFARVSKCWFHCVTAGNWDAAIELGEVADGVVIEGVRILGDFDDAGIHNPTGKVLTNLTIRDSTVQNLQTGDHAIELVSACTGQVENVHLITDAVATAMDQGSLLASRCTFSDSDVPDVAATPYPVTSTTGAVALDTITDALYGTNGIATFPSAAAPANAVSMAEVLRSVYDAVAADGSATTTVHSAYGRRVTKVGDVSGTEDRLFTVTGKCLITMLVGECTSVIATTTSLQLRTSTNDIVLHASTDIVTDVVGTLYILSGDPDDVLNGGSVPNADVAFIKTGTISPIVMNDDAIDQIVDGAGTGLIQWDLYYIPLEASASIASAA